PAQGVNTRNVIRDAHHMRSRLHEYFRIPDESLCSFEFDCAVDDSNANPGFFRFGPNIVCYGRLKSGAVARSPERAASYDASRDVQVLRGRVHLPFDPAQVIDDLLNERYLAGHGKRNGFFIPSFARRAYYAVRDLLPDSVRRQLQRAYLKDWQQVSFPSWPIDTTVDLLHEQLLRLSMEAQGIERLPFVWFWPDGARNCAILTHDVETSTGRDFTSS